MINLRDIEETEVLWNYSFPGTTKHLWKAVRKKNVGNPTKKGDSNNDSFDNLTHITTCMGV